MSRSRITRTLREANAAVEESNATGAPLDEVMDMRRERKAAHTAASREVVEAYNDAAAGLRERGAPEDRVAVALAMDDIHRLRGGARVDRRGFLKGAGVAAAALAAAGLSGKTVLRPARAEAATGPRIAIIGGGLAGLRTAHKLWIDRGLKSTVYEAAEDAGGRCETLRGFFLNGQNPEMHGEFINSEHLSMKNLAARYGLGFDDTWDTPQGTVDTYWINNHRYTQDQVTQDWKAFGYDTFHWAVQQVEAPQTWDNHNAQAAIWDQQDVQTWLTNYLPGGSSTDLYKLALECIAGEWDEAPKVTALGMIWMWGYNTSKKTAHSYQSKSYLYTTGGDERWHITGGNDQIVTGMLGELPAGTVVYNTACVAVAKNADGTYALTLKSGSKTSTVTVDHVVIAAPFSSLRANVDLSKAGISPLKMTAIQNQGMCQDGKVLLQFNGHPWYLNGYDGYMLADSPTNWLWECAPLQTGPTAVMLNYTVTSVTANYIKKYRLTAEEGVAPQGLVDTILAPLDTYFGPGVKAAYNGKAYYHFGTNNKWLKGAYMSYMPGQITGFSGIESVREGNIHFAGDCTSWDFGGFMEGAVESAERAATEI